MSYPNRKHPRLKEYDYRSAGAYFVTICCAYFASLLGEIEGDPPENRLSDYGKAVADEIRKDIISLAVDIVLEKEEVISPMLMTPEHFNKTKDYPFLTNVLEEGVVIG